MRRTRSNVYRPGPFLGRYCDRGVTVAGIVEVGVDFSQSREVKSFAQFDECKGRTLAFMYLLRCGGL